MSLKREVHAEAQYGDIEQHQPEPALDQEQRKLPGRRRGVALPQPRGSTGGEHKDRGAEVRHPAGEKDRGRGARQVIGLEKLRVSVEEITNVVERHQDHDKAAKGVERKVTGRFHIKSAKPNTCGFARRL